MGSIAVFSENGDVNQTIFKLDKFIIEPLQLLAWVFGFYVRFATSGEDCAGENLVTKEHSTHLLEYQGLFIKFSGLFVAFVFVLLIIGKVMDYIARKCGIQVHEVKL